MDETRLADIERELAVLARDCDGHFYTIGARIREVRDGRLYELNAFNKLDDWLAASVNLSRAQAYKWLSVAENYGEETALRLGVERCVAYLKYIRATPDDDRPLDILIATIPVKQADGSIARKPALESTAMEIERAVDLVREKEPLPAEGAALLAKLEAVPSVRASISGTSLTLSIPIAGKCDTLLAIRNALGCE